MPTRIDGFDFRDLLEVFAVGARLVVQRFRKPKVAGSSPVGGSMLARIAQSEERVPCKRDAVGANPAAGSKRSFRGRQAVWHAAVNRAWKHIAGSIPALGANAGEAILVMQQPSKLTKASSILVARSVCARRSAVDRRDDTPELASSILAARTWFCTPVVFVQWPRTLVPQTGNASSILAHDALSSLLPL